MTQSIIKQPVEVLTRTVEFADRLATGDSLDSVTSVTGTPTGLTLSAGTISGTGVVITIEDGTDATVYTIAVVVATTLGETLEEDVYLLVTETVSQVSLDAQRLKVEVADFLWGERNTEGTGTAWTADQEARIASIIKSALSQVYYPISIAKEGQIHRWSFLQPTATIDTSAPYTTGTVAIASGVVTLTTGTWPSWAAEGELVVANSTYPVATRTDDSEIILADTSVTVAAGATYSLNRPYYDMPADFGGMEGDMAFEPGQAQLYPPVIMVSDLEIRRRRQQIVLVDRPQMVAIRPKAFVVTTGQRWQAVFYPTPSAAYRLRYRYRVQPSLEINGNFYLPGGPEIAELCLESCLAIAEQRYKDAPGVHTQNFQRLLAAAVANDLQFATPATLGYDYDASDSGNGDREISSSLIFTFEGKTYY